MGCNVHCCTGMLHCCKCLKWSSQVREQEGGVHVIINPLAAWLETAPRCNFSHPRQIYSHVAIPTTFNQGSLGISIWHWNMVNWLTQEGHFYPSRHKWTWKQASCSRIVAEPRHGHSVCTLWVHRPSHLMENLSPKDTATCDIMKLKVS